MALTLSAQIEAALFAAGESLPKKRLASLLTVSPQELEGALVELADALQGRGLALVMTDTDVELRTHADAADVVKALRESELSRDLGRASLETLALILYRGSATRSEIDWVRGVNSSAAIRALTLRGLIERSEDAADKRRMRYTATVDALAHLGVGTREQLPRYAEFSAALVAEERKAADADATPAV